MAADPSSEESPSDKDSIRTCDCSDYGSWPRVRKQRTEERPMNIFELSAAFEHPDQDDSLSTDDAGALTMLEMTAAALTDDADAETVALAALDWNMLANDGADVVNWNGGTDVVDWNTLAGGDLLAEEAEAVAAEAAVDLVSQARSVAAAGSARFEQMPKAIADSSANVDLDANELLAMLGASPDAMATGDALATPFLPSRPGSPDTALALHMGSLGVGASPVPQPLPPAIAPTRSAERKEWSATEDALIRSGVADFGCKWRKIAAQLPGRSDDAVRNRWHRLQLASETIDEISLEGAAPRRRSSAGGRQAAAAAAADIDSGLEGGAAPVAAKPTGKPERLSWTPAEDAVIMSSVGELGHKWYRIAQRLPGRTEHAIRNRYHRLQSARADAAQQEQQRLELPSTQPLLAELADPVDLLPIALPVGCGA